MCMNGIAYAYYPSPVGGLVIGVCCEGIAVLRAAVGGEEALPEAACPLLRDSIRWLDAYFAGQNALPDLPLAEKGTPFERAVWAQLRAIPFGETRTYGQIAAALGRPGASRAVGRACSANPVLILTPCHRVVGAAGTLTGFAAGLDMKRALLIHEGHGIRENRLIQTLI